MLDWWETFFPDSVVRDRAGREPRSASKGDVMAADPKQTTASEELKYASANLRRETGWWGAFVIGLAGTILVTGIAPVMVTALGASSIPITIFITLTGWLLCLFLAELAAMMPERTGGSPSYAYPAFKDRWPRFAKHINGFTAWAYWLGWFPGGAAQHDPGVVLSGGSLPPQYDSRLHADPYFHRLVDADHLDRGHPSVLHPGLSRHSLRRHVCDGPRAACR